MEAERNAIDPLIGRTLGGKFRLDALVGRGAMGAVYRASQIALKKTVAIKVMHGDRPAGSTFAARFKREAKAAARMDHPNSIRIIDVGDDDGLLYIAMEFLEGRNLLEVLRAEFPLTKDRIIHVLSQTLAALAVGHELGVVHRDMKPENIMLVATKDDEGNATEIVKVCDFGVAKLLEPADPVDPALRGTQTHTGNLTAHGMLIGTPEYMSPEQARGEPADPRSDLYSLGVILFQLLTGRLPFVATSKIRLVIKHVEEPPPLPTEFDSKIDLRLEAICMKALAKRPSDRFASAREMRAALREVLDDRPESLRLLAAARLESARPQPAAAPRESNSGAAAMSPSVGQTAVAEPLQVTEPVPTHNPVEMTQALREVRERLSGRPLIAEGPGLARVVPLWGVVVLVLGVAVLTALIVLFMLRKP